MGYSIERYSDSEATPTGLAGLLAIAHGQAAGIRGLPDGFIPPNLFPDYVPANMGWMVYVVCKVSMSIAFIVVCGRLIAKSWLAKGLTVDDYAIIPALLLTLGLTLDVSFAVRYGGMGKHIWDLSYEEVQNGLKIMYAHILLYVCSMFFIKLSLLLFLYRLFYSTASNRLQKFFIGFFIFHISFLIVCILTFTLQCNPPAAGYSISLRLGKGTTCGNYLYAYHILSIIHIASDLAVVALPMVLVWKMNIKGRKKFTVIALFGLAGIACICAMMRMAYFLGFTTSFDVSWVAVRLAIWGQLEATIALVATSVPGIKLLVSRYGSKQFPLRGLEIENITVTERAAGPGDNNLNINQCRTATVPISDAELNAMENGDSRRGRKTSCVTHGSLENGSIDCVCASDITSLEEYVDTREKIGRQRDDRRPSWRNILFEGDGEEDAGSINYNANREYHFHQVAIAADGGGVKR